MTDPGRDDDLAERVAELEESLSELRAELRRPPRGPLGLPRPPTPRELLRFTERHAIPTTIAILEANVRALRLLQGALRMTDPERAAGEGVSQTRERAGRAGRAVVERLDGALSDLQAELEEGDLPRDGEARDIVQDARRLSAEIHDRLGTDDAGTDPARRNGDSADDGRPTAVDVQAEDAAASDPAESRPDDAVQIDVEDELRSIKDELDGGDDPGGRGPDDVGEDADAAGDARGTDGRDDGTTGSDGGSDGGRVDGENGRTDGENGRTDGDDDRTDSD